MTKKRKSFFYNLLVILFLCHGVLYYFTPNDIYNYSNPIKIIKYIILLIVVLSNIFHLHVKETRFLVEICMILVFNNLLATGEFEYSILLKFILPLCIIIIYPVIIKYVNISLCVKITYWLSSVMAYLEYFVIGKLFYQYADSGYRVCSIFVNPNNFSIMLWLLSCYIYAKNYSVKFKVFTTFNTIILLILSGSRAGMVVTGFLYLAIIMMKVYEILSKKAIPVIKILLINMLAVCIPIFTLYNYGRMKDFATNLFKDVRRIGDISLKVGRFEQFSMFLENVSLNPLFPNRLSGAYTDNMYFYIWGHFGIFVLLGFIVLNTGLIIKAYKQKQTYILICLLCFLIVGLAENYMYLWPGGYIYWYLVCAIRFAGSSRKDNKSIRFAEEPLSFREEPIT